MPAANRTLSNTIFEPNEFHQKRALFIMHSARSALSFMKNEHSLPVQGRPDTKHYTEVSDE
jgi:hypothetical protein